MICVNVCSTARLATDVFPSDVLPSKMLVPILLPFCLVMLQAWWDPTFGGSYIKGDVDPAAVKKWPYRRRLRYTLSRAWELSQVGPFFRLGAWLGAKVGVGLRSLGMASRLDRPPTKPTALVITPGSMEAMVRWTLPSTGLLSVEWSVLEVAQADANADVQWTEAYSGPAPECNVVFPTPWRTCRVRVATVNSQGQSNWTTAPEFFCVHTAEKGVGGYGPEQTYQWSQSDTEVEVRLPAPPDCAAAKDLVVSIRPTQITVAAQTGGGSPLLEGKFRYSVDPDGSFWELTDGKDGVKEILVTLCKKQAEASWAGVIIGHPRIDIGEQRGREKMREAHKELSSHEQNYFAEQIKQAGLLDGMNLEGSKIS
jgi:hypothetical protein